MIIFINTVLVVVINFFAIGVFAESSPLAQTQEVLKNPHKRETAIQEEGEKAKQADAFAKKVGGSSQNTEKIYGISAEAMKYIDQTAGGDPEKMQNLLDQAQKDPKAFFKSLPPEVQNQIKTLSSEIESQNKPVRSTSP